MCAVFSVLETLKYGRFPKPVARQPAEDIASVISCDSSKES
jgi:hypothetical protein